MVAPMITPRQRSSRADPPRTTTVRLRPDERRLVEVAARARGVGPSTYLRLAVLEVARRDVIAAAIAEPAAPGSKS